MELAELVLRPMGRLSVGLAAAATVTMLVLIGAGAMTLPAPCSTDAAGRCPAGAAEPAKAGAPAVKAAAAPAASALISATFDKLQSQPAPSGGNAAVAAANSGTSKAVSRRVVQTIAVRPGAAAPDASSAAFVPAVPALARPVPLAPANPATPTIEPIAAAANPAPAADPVADVAAIAPPTPLAPVDRPAQTDGKTMQVGGKGVTVRSGPSKSRSTLFNLAARQKVTIVGRQRGWLQIVDAQGRHGWAYSDFFNS